MQRTLFILFHALLLLFRFKSTNSSSFRRIKEGKDVDVDMNFMVYLVKAPRSVQRYDAWICGGAIVSSEFIVTSAACVEDVEYMYAIAGYNKYVNGPDVETDECTKNSRKKVVFTCVPKSYDFAYEHVRKWAFIDIAAVRVESPYDFNTKSAGCSWAPRAIDINYDPKYQEPKTDAMVLGWGHTEKWRLPGDTKDYNQEKLQYGSILLMSKSECKEFYKNYEGMSAIIDKYMICAMKEGNIDDKGNLKSKVTPDPTLTDGCKPGAVRVGGQCQSNREDEIEPLRMNKKSLPSRLYRSQPNPLGYTGQEQVLRPRQPTIMPPRQNPFNARPSQNINSYDMKEDVTFDDIALNFRRTNNLTQDGKHTYTRKAGICQNDHGGPIVTWVGKHEVLIGVASVFRVNRSYYCDGPYLFTSTQCNGAFLDCVINQMFTPVQGQTTTTPLPTTNSDTDTDAMTLGTDAISPHTGSVVGNLLTLYGFREKCTTQLLFNRPNAQIPNNEADPVIVPHENTRQLFFKRPNPQGSYNNYEEAADPLEEADQPVYDETLQYKRRAGDFCNLPPEQRGFHMVERRISWRNHPDGPAQNELNEDLFYRPIKPLT